jgi:GNAT superfamily N-acetyltransferase
MDTKINIILLDAKDIERFDHMIPEQLKGCVLQNEYVVLGAVCGDVTMGVGIFKEYARYLELMWIYVEPEFRRYGICTLMLNRIKENVSNSTYLLGIFSDFLKLGNEHLCTIFEKNGFEIIEDEWPIYTFSINEAIGVERYVVNKKLFKDNVCRISECSGMAKRYFSQKLAMAEEINPIELPIEWELYDDDMSRIYHENNEIKVVLLVENKEDYLNVAFAYAKDNPYAFPYMIGDAYIKARELYENENKKILVTSLDDNVDKLLLNLIPAARKNSMLHVKISL